MENIFGIYVKYGKKINARRCPREPRGRGARPGPSWALVRRLLLFFGRKKANFQKKIEAKVSIQSELRISIYTRNGETEPEQNAKTER